MPEYSATKDHFVSIGSGGNQMMAMHYHPSYELYYLEAGSRRYFVGDKLFTVSAGEFVLIPPGVLHRTGGEYGTRTLVGFTYSYLASAFSQEMLSKLLVCFEHVKLLPGENQKETCKTLIRKLTVCEDDTAFALILGLLLQELSQCSYEELSPDRNSAIVSFINRNYAEITNINQIAEHFFISKYHLCRVFREAMQISVVDYLNQIRIKNACGFLEATDKSISEISVRCGYNSSAYFSNTFKKITGRSPAQYRKEQKRKNR